MTRQQKKELQKYQNCLPYVKVKDNAIEIVQQYSK